MGEEAEPAMRKEAEQEPSDEPTDDLGQAIADAERNCASEKEKKKLKRMLEDHKKLLYPNCEGNKKKLGTTLEIAEMEGTGRCSWLGIWKLAENIEEYVSKE